MKTKINPGGIFITQSGAAGVKSHKLVYSAINRTVREAFKHVIPMSQVVYSFLDEWGYQMASDAPLDIPPTEDFDRRIAERIEGELKFLDAESFRGVTALSKGVRATLAAETTVMSTEGTHRFMHSIAKGVAERACPNELCTCAECKCGSSCACNKGGYGGGPQLSGGSSQ